MRVGAGRDAAARNACGKFADGLAPERRVPAVWYAEASGLSGTVASSDGRTRSALPVVAELRLDDVLVGERDGQESLAGGRREQLDAGAGVVAEEARRRTSRTATAGRALELRRRRSRRRRREMRRPSGACRTGPRPVAGRVVPARVGVDGRRRGELISTSTRLCLVISVLCKVAGCLRVAGVLPRRGVDPVRRSQLRVRRRRAARPSRRRTDSPAASAPASARFWSCRLCVYQLPTSTTSAVRSSMTGIMTAARTITCRARRRATRLMCRMPSV